MQTMKNYDVAIVGAGMVGLATAIGLAQIPLNVVVIDSRKALSVTGEAKLRVSAINHASERLLTNLGVWQDLIQSRITPYDKMQIWDCDNLGKLGFDAKTIGEENLGYIIENENIISALIERASEFDNITYLDDSKLDNLSFGEREVWLSLNGGDNISARLLIGADGANSWVREQSKIPLTFYDYGHHAIVATIKTELPHQHVARQAFLASGPLAFLPLFEPQLNSIVWSLPPAEAEALLAMEPIEFEQALSVAFNTQLGVCSLVSERHSFPLRMRYARDFVQHRLLLIGDAAHTIHPLAGLGVNLGLIDAAATTQTLTKLTAQKRDIGNYVDLRALERWRKADATAMIASMEGLKKLFSGDNPIKKGLRDLGLNVIDSCPPVKIGLLQLALGNSKHLPKQCRK